MAYCYNCRTEIPDNDKTRLCDRCKTIILPFVKLMNASTSSAVRRLLSNERNLRNIGVTDGGMEYLLRVCELHDKKRLTEKAAQISAMNAEERMTPQPMPEVVSAPISEPPSPTTEVEDDEEFYEPKSFVWHIVCAVVMFLCGVGMLGYFIYEGIASETYRFVTLFGSVGFFAAAACAMITRKLAAELDRIKTK